MPLVLRVNYNGKRSILHLETIIFMTIKIPTTAIAPSTMKTLVVGNKPPTTQPACPPVKILVIFIRTFLSCSKRKPQAQPSP
mmetsp:Transcript_39969/g.61161  ORF Transcript_39969/g.61161 Transcript_39969/m.61161 type:complete len:82 (+) Transcript_39969:813-1058(+)